MAVTLNHSHNGNPHATSHPAITGANTAGPSWLKRGTDSVKAVVEAEQDAQMRQAERGKMYSWSLKKGEEGRLTFIDGDLTDGYLLPPRFYAHSVMSGKVLKTFVCPEKTNPQSGEKCPICEQEGKAPALVALFTVIDHREHPGKEGKVYKNYPKLLLAKPRSFELLNKFAVKLGGLAGQTFEVSRSTSETSVGIGDVFIPMEKSPVELLKSMYMREIVDPTTNKKSMVSMFVPADYEKEFAYYSASELRAMGFGAGMTTGMSQPNGAPGNMMYGNAAPSATHANYAAQL